LVFPDFSEQFFGIAVERGGKRIGSGRLSREFRGFFPPGEGLYEVVAVGVQDIENIIEQLAVAIGVRCLQF